jgi:hypothetical protein
MRNRTLTWRGVLAGLALAAVGIAALIGWLSDDHPGTPTQTVTAPTVTATATATPAATATVSPEPTAARDDGAVPATGTPAADTRPQVDEAATHFAAAWINTYPQSAAQWREKLLELVTDEQAALLAKADPDKVPDQAQFVGDHVESAPLGEGGLWEAAVPLLTGPAGKPAGTLTLTLMDVDDRWLVHEIDWQVA